MKHFIVLKAINLTISVVYAADSDTLQAHVPLQLTTSTIWLLTTQIKESSNDQKAANKPGSRLWKIRSCTKVSFSCLYQWTQKVQALLPAFNKCI